MLGTWFYEHPHCTHRDILLFLFLKNNVLIVRRSGSKRRLNALIVNVSINVNVSIIIFKILAILKMYKYIVVNKQTQLGNILLQICAVVLRSFIDVHQPTAGYRPCQQPPRVSQPPLDSFIPPSRSRVRWGARCQLALPALRSHLF